MRMCSKKFHDQNVTLVVYSCVCDERLSSSSFVKVVDCRICGDPHSVLRFAFVEFADDRKFGCWNL